MKNIIYSVIVALLLTACASSVHVQKDNSVNLSNYHTYMWIDTKSSENDSLQRPAMYADIPVRNAANEELSKAGFREVKDNPDLLISYDVLVERQRIQRSDPVYSQPFTRMYYSRRTGSWNTIYYPSQFLGYDNYDVAIKEGTITITMIDASTDKNVWQGWTTNELNYTRLTEGEIQASVKSIMGKLNVKR
ncbi:MAG: DUF4136 domain-containing protein [Bacteroidota bacterium]